MTPHPFLGRPRTAARFFLPPFASCLLAVALASAHGREATPPPVRADNAPERVIVNARGIEAVGSEHQRVGPNEQPEWTTRRVFAETDVYVLPPGAFEFNQFYISGHPRHGVPGNLFESEFELGLPFRTQFDVELDYSIHHGGKLRYDGTLIELPHALAKWGRIPLNPTVDAGWRFISDAPDAFFFRLLLAEELSKRLHFGANFTFDRQIGGERQTSFEFNHALSYVLVDGKLSLGYELRVEHEREQAEGEAEASGERRPGAPPLEGAGADGDDDDGDAPRPRFRRGRFDRTTTALLGPSVLYRPTRSTYVSLVSLFGLTNKSSVAEVYVVFGVDFGPRGATGGPEENDAGRAPLSRRRR